MLERRDLLVRKARDSIGPVTSWQVLFRVERTVARVINETILQTVEGITLSVDSISKDLDFLPVQGSLLQCSHAPGLREFEAGVVVSRSPGNNAIEVVGESLCRHQGLPSTGGASHEIAVRGSVAVVLLS